MRIETRAWMAAAYIAAAPRTLNTSNELNVKKQQYKNCRKMPLILYFFFGRFSSLRLGAIFLAVGGQHYVNLSE